MKQRIKNSHLFLKYNMFKRNIKKKNRNKNFLHKFKKKLHYKLQCHLNVFNILYLPFSLSFLFDYL